jgi:hypothetical protein
METKVFQKNVMKIVAFKKKTQIIAKSIFPFANFVQAQII